MSKLSVEEREILEAIDKGKSKRSKKAGETQNRHQEYVETMFRKDARINIRLPSKGLRWLRKKYWLRVSRIKLRSQASFTSTWEDGYTKMAERP